MSEAVAFGTFDKCDVSEQMVFCLLTGIQERRLPPDDKLPPDRDLAQAMLDHLDNVEQDLKRPALLGARSMPPARWSDWALSRPLDLCFPGTIGRVH